jgi:hypothetical protein
MNMTEAQSLLNNKGLALTPERQNALITTKHSLEAIEIGYGILDAQGLTSAGLITMLKALRHPKATAAAICSCQAKNLLTPLTLNLITLAKTHQEKVADTMQILTDNSLLVEPYMTEILSVLKHHEFAQALACLKQAGLLERFGPIIVSNAKHQCVDDLAKTLVLLHCAKLHQISEKILFKQTFICSFSALDTLSNVVGMLTQDNVDYIFNAACHGFRVNNIATLLCKLSQFQQFSSNADGREALVALLNIPRYGALGAQYFLTKIISVLEGADQANNGSLHEREPLFNGKNVLALIDFSRRHCALGVFNPQYFNKIPAGELTQTVLDKLFQLSKEELDPAEKIHAYIDRIIAKKKQLDLDVAVEPALVADINQDGAEEAAIEIAAAVLLGFNQSNTVGFFRDKENECIASGSASSNKREHPTTGGAQEARKISKHTISNTGWNCGQ